MYIHVLFVVSLYVFLGVSFLSFCFVVTLTHSCVYYSSYYIDAPPPPPPPPPPVYIHPTSTPSPSPSPPIPTPSPDITNPATSTRNPPKVTHVVVPRSGSLDQVLASNRPQNTEGGGENATVMSDGSGETQQTTGTFMTTATSNIPLTRVPHRRPSTTIRVKGAYFIDNPVLQAKSKKIPYVRRPDKTRLQCFNCKKKFGLRLQRHHCRSCGDVYWSVSNEIDLFVDLVIHCRLVNLYLNLLMCTVSSKCSNHKLHLPFVPDSSAGVRTCDLCYEHLSLGM